jgi:glycosyltransferase involved in cell wall biosynthesis
LAQIQQYTPREFSDLRVAIVHDWLTVYAGAERVLAQIIEVLPHADIFSLVDFMPGRFRGFLRNKQVQTSFLQRLPFAKNKYRNYFPVMPFAIEQFNFAQYDLIVSSNYAVAKGIITTPDQIHVSYVHSPARYAWDLQHEYLEQQGVGNDVKGLFVRWMLHRFRVWDVRTANGVDYFLANSRFIQRRIWKSYRRESTVIYPPVEVERFKLHDSKEDYFMTASRMVPYKRIDLIVEAFRHLPSKRLLVIGDGPEMPKIRSMATENVSILGYQSDDNLRHHMQRARAFVFAAQEDFGIVPVEAQACGTPVIAYGRGGVTESVRGLDAEHPTGVFFAEPTVESLIEAIEVFEANRGSISPSVCRESAWRFASDRFRGELAGFLRRTLAGPSDLDAPAHPASLYGRAVGAD